MTGFTRGSLFFHERKGHGNELRALLGASLRPKLLSKKFKGFQSILGSLVLPTGHLAATSKDGCTLRKQKPWTVVGGGLVLGARASARSAPCQRGSPLRRLLVQPTCRAAGRWLGLHSPLSDGRGSRGLRVGGSSWEEDSVLLQSLVWEEDTAWRSSPQRRSLTRHGLHRGAGSVSTPRAVHTAWKK